MGGRQGKWSWKRWRKKSVEISASLTDLKMSQQTMQLVVVVVVAVVCCTLFLLLLLVTCLHTMHLVVVICLRCCCCTSCLPACKSRQRWRKCVRERKRGGRARQHDGDMTYFCICVAAPETATFTPLLPCNTALPRPRLLTICVA